MRALGHISAIAMVLYAACTGAQDADGDSIADALDNCSQTANAGQADSDGDAIGNACDADFDNSCTVNFTDLALLKENFFTAGDSQFDLTDDGAVNFSDLGIVKTLFLLPPGPSGLANGCSDGIFLCGITGTCDKPPDNATRFANLGGGRLGLTLDLAGAVELTFRIVDSDGISVGATFDCGSDSLFTPLIPGESFTLDCNPGANELRLNLTREGAGGVYYFVLEGYDTPTPSLQVSPAGEGPAGTPGDVTPPQVALSGTLPGGQTLDGDQVILATASDAESLVAWVEFLVDGQVTWRDYTSPYEAPWDTQEVANGVHELTAVAVDAANNQAQSSPSSVTVNNVGPYGVDMYPRGSWDPNFDLLPGQLPMDYLGSGRYASTLTLADGNFRYKIASDDFDQALSNCNPLVDNTPAVLTEPQPFVCSAMSGNARLNLSLEPSDTDYVFALDAGRSLEQPLATVRRAALGPDPAQGDETPPTFTSDLLLFPPSVPVQGDVIITATVTDDNAVASVAFFVDGELLWRDFTEPFQAPWTSLQTDNGLRTVTAQADDANGNVAGSAPLFVEVDNPPLGPFGVPMFVRGAFVDDADFQFGTDHPLVLLDENSDVYQAIVNIDRTTEAPTEFFIGFKVADAGWTEGTNCGVGSVTTVALGAQTELICSAADNNDDPTANITLNLLSQPQPDEYVFTIDASGFPTVRPTVTVTRDP